MASSLEVNKTLAAILTAGIIASGAGVVSRIIYSPHLPEENAYPIEVASAEGETAEDGGAAESINLAALLATGSPEAGATVAKKCAACHNFEEGGANKIGPGLWGVVGRDIASVEGFAYSDALASREGAWDYESLSHFLADPKGWAPGTKMAFAGVKDEEDLANLILHLRALSPDAPPLPEPETETAAAGEPAAAALRTPRPGNEQPAAEGEEAAAQDAGAEQTAAVQPEADQTSAPPAAAGQDEAASSRCSPRPIRRRARRRRASAPSATASRRAARPSSARRYGAWSAATSPRSTASPTRTPWPPRRAPGTMRSSGRSSPVRRSGRRAPRWRSPASGRTQELAEVIAYLRSLADNPEPLPAGG